MLDEPPELIMPCDVESVVQTNCQTCHGQLPIGGHDLRLVTLEDFQRDWVVQTTPSLMGDTIKVHELVRIRINGEQDAPRMPQGALITERDLTLLNDWVASGAPGVEACPPPEPEPPPPPPTPPPGTVPLAPRDGESCHDFPVHNLDGPDDDTPFRVEDGDRLARFYYEIPWPDDAVATRVGADVDRLDVAHTWRLFEADRNPHPPGSVVRAPSDHVHAGLITGWTSGSRNWEMPPDVGLQLPNASADRLLMIEWRYYSSLGVPVDDGSKVQVCTVPADSRAHVAGITWLGTESIALEPGPGSASGTCRNRTAEPIHVLMLRPHTHLLGTALYMNLVRLDGSSLLVFDEPLAFDYEVQHYSSGLVIQPGERLRTTCEYENTDGAFVGFGDSLAFETCYQLVYAYPAGALDKPTNPNSAGASNTCWGD